MAASAPDLGKAADLAQLDRLLGAFYEGPMESPPWQSALQLLRDTLKAGHVTLMLRPPSPDSTGVMINTGPVTDQGVESYETHFFAMDPFVRLQEGEVVTAEELIGKAWLDSSIYNEYLKPLGIR
ncbi:MAG TPA: helix-turn-helix transcriptional regulator, partial [Solimonas sp.]|nr:helix-turn-helix transcriptional regulator [Solimonas sp.]